MVKNLLIAIGGLLVLAVLWTGWQAYEGQQAPVVGEEAMQDPEGTRLAGDAIPVPYVCADGKTLGIIYDESYAQVQFEDGTSQGLIRGDVEGGSGDEVVFGNADGTVQLWVKEFSAFLMQNGVEVYSACRVTDAAYPVVQ
mgnify:FL=1